MRSRARAWLAMAALATATATAAHAQNPDNKVAAEALFDEARKLMNEGKPAQACAKFEQSQRLDPGIGTLLYLADCYEKAGRFASAWATFREGASQARAAGQADRASAGESRAAALEGRLSRLTVEVAPENAAVEGFTLRRGGNPIAKELWGVSVPVDGGEWTIEASAPGAQPWSKKIVVAPENDTAKVTVPALGAKPEPEPVEPAPAPPVVVTPAPAPVGPPRDAQPAGDTQRTAALIVGGVGLIGVGFGTYFGLRAFSKNADAKELCDGAACSERRGVDLTDEARDAAVLSNVAFGIGLTALAGGAVLYLTAPSGKTNALHVAPRVGKRGGGLSLGGTF